jgi:transposase-like protein
MERRKWDPKIKSMTVLQGLKGRPISEICTEHQISQAQYYQWRDQFLANMHQVFVKDERRDKALTKENARLLKIIGDLPVDLKKQKSGYDETQGISIHAGTQRGYRGKD